MSARKPVRAWAVVGEQGHIAQDEGSMAWRTRLGAAPHARMTDDVVRVTLVPDGTPSQDAEVRRLRRLLREIRWTFEDAARVPPEDIIARQAINAANDVFPHSYGALMSQASLMWRESAARRGEPLGGEHAVACCRATAKDYLKKIDAALRGRRGR